MKHWTVNVRLIAIKYRLGIALISLADEFGYTVEHVKILLRLHNLLKRFPVFSNLPYKRVLAILAMSDEEQCKEYLKLNKGIRHKNKVKE